MKKFNFNLKLWALNIFFAGVIITAMVLVFKDHRDASYIFPTMIGIPLTAMAGEMGIYAHHVSKDFNKQDKNDV